MEYTLLDYSGTVSKEVAVTTVNEVGLKAIITLDYGVHLLLKDGYVIVCDCSEPDYDIYSTEHVTE